MSEPVKARGFVPCDDAAIARAAEAFEKELMDRGGDDEFLYDMDEDTKAEFVRDMAVAVLRAAAGDAMSVTEFRVCVLNDGTPFGPLELPCCDQEAAERKRTSWAADPEVGEPAGAKVWIESRVIGPWVKGDA